MVDLIRQVYYYLIKGYLIEQGKRRHPLKRVVLTSAHFYTEHFCVDDFPNVYYSSRPSYFDS
jgi:hypothetical protein